MTPFNRPASWTPSTWKLHVPHILSHQQQPRPSLGLSHVGPALTRVMFLFFSAEATGHQDVLGSGCSGSFSGSGCPSSRRLLSLLSTSWVWGAEVVSVPLTQQS